MDMREGMGLTRYRGDVVSAFQYALIIFTLTGALFQVAAIVIIVVRLGGAAASAPWGAGLNLGALAFIGVLVFVGAYTEPVRYTAPVMGAAVLLGIGTYLSRLRAE